jgi:hypothetical protein
MNQEDNRAPQPPLPSLDNTIKMDSLLVGSLHLPFHYLISGFLLHAVKFYVCWFQLFCDLMCPIMVENMVKGGPY